MEKEQESTEKKLEELKAKLESLEGAKKQVEEELVYVRKNMMNTLTHEKRNSDEVLWVAEDAKAAAENRATKAEEERVTAEEAKVTAEKRAKEAVAAFKQSIEGLDWCVRSGAEAVKAAVRATIEYVDGQGLGVDWSKCPTHPQNIEMEEPEEEDSDEGEGATKDDDPMAADFQGSLAEITGGGASESAPNMETAHLGENLLPAI